MKSRSILILVPVGFICAGLLMSFGTPIDDSHGTVNLDKMINHQPMQTSQVNLFMIGWFLLVIGLGAAGIAPFILLVHDITVEKAVN